MCRESDSSRTTQQPQRSPLFGLAFDGFKIFFVEYVYGITRYSLPIDLLTQDGEAMNDN
jgi:hypothetical protein